MAPLRLATAAICLLLLLSSAPSASASASGSPKPIKKATASKAKAASRRVPTPSISLDPTEDSASAPSQQEEHQQQQKPSRRREGQKNTVNVRGSEDLELNCPSISYRFADHSTLRCESCKTLGRVLHYALVHYHRTAEDMLISGPTQRGPELCVLASVSAELRQKTNGRRFWDLTRLMKQGDVIEHSPYVDHDYDPLPEAHSPAARTRELRRARSAGHGAFSVEDPTDYPIVATNDKAVSVNNRRVTYHTKDERETLPCANYFFNRYCMSEYLGDDDTADAIDGCVNSYTAVRASQDRAVTAAAKRRLKEAKAAGGANADSLSLAAFEAEERQAIDKSQAAERLSASFLTCLTGKLCGSIHRNECDTRQLFEMQRGEREDFLRYEARHGNPKNPFVGTALDARRLERNPYARPPSSGSSAEAEGAADL